jgi:hypothetical protein
MGSCDFKTFILIRFNIFGKTFLAKKNLAKSLLISTLDKVIYYKGTFLQGSTKPLFTTQNMWKKLPLPKFSITLDDLM